MGRQSKCKVPEETTACSPARLVLAVFRQEIGRGLEEGLVSDKRPIFLLALEQSSWSRSKERTGLSVKGRDGLDLMLGCETWCRSGLVLLWVVDLTHPLDVVAPTQSVCHISQFQLTPAFVWWLYSVGVRDIIFFCERNLKSEVLNLTVLQSHRPWNQFKLNVVQCFGVFIGFLGLCSITQWYDRSPKDPNDDVSKVRLSERLPWPGTRELRVGLHGKPLDDAMPSVVRYCPHITSIYVNFLSLGCELFGCFSLHTLAFCQGRANYY